MLCVLMYVRTGCGLRTVVSILGILNDILGDSFGKAPSYNTVRNWVLKLGLSIYEQDTQLSSKYGVMLDESIMINKERLLLVLGFNTDKTEGPLKHKDVEVLGMKVGES